jgi:hypothetical protein
MTEIPCFESDIVINGIIKVKLDIYKALRVLFIAYIYSTLSSPQKSSCLIGRGEEYISDAGSVLSRLVSTGKKSLSSVDKLEIKKLDKMITDAQSLVTKLKVQQVARFVLKFH